MTRRFIELLWFGRPSSIVAQTLVASVPIVFTLLAQNTPTFFNTYGTQQLIALLLVVVFLTTILNFWLLSKAGASTYSPLLHSPKWILTSAMLNLLIGCLIAYAGYLLLLYPETERIVPPNNGLLAGGVVSALYSVLLAGAHATATLSRTERNEKERLIETFLRECDNLESSAEKAIEADTDTIDDVVRTLKTKFSNEPMHDASEVEEKLSEWHTSFQQYNTGGQRKMVGGGADSVDEMSETWRALYQQYQFARKKLSDMQTSAFSSVTNG
jgi:hypothetical protein